MKIEPTVLLLTSIRDLATDLVCHELGQRNVPFLRLNIEQMPEWALTLDPVGATMACRMGPNEWNIGAPALKTVWWRQASFSRNTPAVPLSPVEQLVQSQWPALMRGLMLFDHAAWYNLPASIYLAECKPYQLRAAGQVGFAVPATIMTNDNRADVPSMIGSRIAAKSVDTAYLVQPAEQYFAYTRIVDWDECNDGDLHLAPLTCQQVLSPKLDLRVTLIGAHIWCHAISHGDSGIEGDWRLLPKGSLRYDTYSLPGAVEAKCRELVANLGLRFAAIDLARVGETYWFVELNPTGEWAWLDEDRSISVAIAECLAA